MIVVMAPAADAPAIEHVIARLTERGFDVHRSTGAERTVLGVVGPTQELDTAELELLPGVEEVVRVSTPYKLVSRAFHPEDTLVRVGEIVFGGEEVIVAAGPCSVESEDQIRRTAAAVRAAGARLLRGVDVPEDWEPDARATFLEGYYDRVEPSLLPPGEAPTSQLLAVFELEKAVYELRYELNNRPDWVSIPVAGILRLLDMD